jgi:precorrin-6Y C5,15-methyltransferase (decarboxylating)
VAGLGADGWPGLSPLARDAIEHAEVIIGGARHLALLPAGVTGRRVELPSPLLPSLPGLIAELAGSPLVVLASGDPMFYGIGTTLARLLGPGRLRVLPHPSSVSLAAARLGWPSSDVDVVSLVGRPRELLHPLLQPGRRVLVLTAETTAATSIQALLDARGFGASPVTVLADLGSDQEVVAPADGRPHSRLAIVAIECRLDAGTPPLSRVPGLPDDAFEQDGQITKHEIRALALAALVPVPGQLLWDVGAGGGSISIEWLRTEPTANAIAIEEREDRAARAAANARRLGVPELEVRTGRAPEALAGLPPPDAVFLGGGLTETEMVERCYQALRPGGRLVANAVTLEGERALLDARSTYGGELTRIEIGHAEPVGALTAWRARLPIVQWGVHKS